MYYNFQTDVTNLKIQKRCARTKQKYIVCMLCSLPCDPAGRLHGSVTRDII